MRRKLLYLCLMLFTVYVEIMYDESRAVLFLGFEMVLGAVMFLMALYLKFRVKLEVVIKSDLIPKGKPVEAEVTVSNRGWLAATRVSAELVLEIPGYGTEQEEWLLYDVDGKKRTKTERSFPAPYCGKYTVCVRKERVSDYLGLFRFSIGKGSRACVKVLPRLCEIPVEVGERTRNFPVDGEEYDPHRSGDDPSEIFQIRAYRPGDGMQRIHWKMSAKAGEWMTKEYGLPVGCCVLLLLDLYQERGGKLAEEEMDRIIETAVSVSYSLALAGCIHYIAWYEEDTGAIHRCYIKGEEEVYELQEEILEAIPYSEEWDLESGYHFRFPEGKYATILRLDGSLRLWRNGELFADLSRGELQELGKRLILQV